MGGSRLALLTLLFPALSCLATQPGLDPEATLSRYLSATKAGRWAVAYGDLSANDRAYLSFEDYRSAHAESPLAALRARAEFEIKESTLDGDTATFVVAVTRVDENRLDNALDDDPLYGVTREAEMARMAGEGNLPMATRNETFLLLREKGLWKVFLGLEVDALVAEGRRLQEERDFAAAKSEFEAALRSHAGSAEASAGLKEVEEALAKRPEQRAYFSSIEIRDVRVERGENRLHDDVLVHGEVENTGERTLSRLEVRATCFDDAGNGVYEKGHLVLFVPDEHEHSDEPDPLKPDATREFHMDLKGAPCWSGDVRVGVLALELVQ